MINYENDFYGWTQEQAFLLKSGRFSEVDLLNLIEEVETMGRSEKRELLSRLTVLLAHLLKWQCQPVRRSTSWELTIKNQRIDLKDVISDNPSLKPQLDILLVKAYEKARIVAAQETSISLNIFPAQLPWILDQLLDDSFFPN